MKNIGPWLSSLINNAETAIRGLRKVTKKALRILSSIHLANAPQCLSGRSAIASIGTVPIWLVPRTWNLSAIGSALRRKSVAIPFNFQKIALSRSSAAGESNQVIGRADYINTKD